MTMVDTETVIEEMVSNLIDTHDPEKVSAVLDLMGAVGGFKNADIYILSSNLVVSLLRQATFDQQKINLAVFLSLVITMLREYEQTEMMQ